MQETSRSGGLSLIRKDISWLWRTGYNTAIAGCERWTGTELGISVLFERTGQVSFHFPVWRRITHKVLAHDLII